MVSPEQQCVSIVTASAVTLCVLLLDLGLLWTAGEETAVKTFGAGAHGTCELEREREAGMDGWICLMKERQSL